MSTYIAGQTKFVIL